MLSRGRSFVAPAYLFACLVLGGSVQGIWQNMMLQLAGVAIIAWAAMNAGGGAGTAGEAAAGYRDRDNCASIAIQLIPLPASLWSHLGPTGASCGRLPGSRHGSSFRAAFADSGRGAGCASRDDPVAGDRLRDGDG